MFKTKSKMRNELLIKLFIFIILFIIIIRLCFSILFNSKILNNVFNVNKLSIVKENLLKFNKPEKLLSYYKEKDIIKYNYIKANYTLNNKPIIYIYNTHQKEAYTDKKDVYDASYYFKEKLNKLNIDVIVEDTNITEFMSVNNLSYGYSYYASKFFIKDAISKYKFDLIIDLHRDAAPKKNTTTTINKKSCAKILFVVGKEHKNYKVNYNLANTINNKIKNKYPSLTKGVMLKSGKNVNGIYNQNLNSNMILLEVGGHLNNYEEVKNTIDLIVPIIGEYIYEKR